VLALLAGISIGRAGGWWPIVFGIISLAAGIVVISTPVSSVTVLATLMGIWFVVMGLLEMAGAFAVRHASRRAGAGQVSVPGQRAGDGTSASAGPDGSPAAGQKVQG